MEMTNKEAIETIKANYPDERYTMLREALDMAIKALERRISKPVRQPIGVGSHLIGTCPSCFHVLMQEDHPAYCGMCGQKVKWDDSD